MVENYHSSSIAKVEPIHLSGDIWLVPCVPKYPQGYYEAIYKPLDVCPKSNEYLKKIDWTKQEDELLVDLVNSNGPKNWNKIAALLNQATHKGLEIRHGRQCRGRWMNYLDPNINKDQWTKEEDSLLIELQNALGNKWKKISKSMIGRSENSVRRRWKILSKSKQHKDENHGFNIEDFDKIDNDCIGAYSVAEIEGHNRKFLEADDESKWQSEGDMDYYTES